MFTKVLIANRGAIAVRIERTLRRMGISSVAVYTDADQDSLHVDGADEAVRIGEGAAKDSYLNMDLVLQTAIATGAEAIHPGYGFLSENATFARMCQERGLVFIGPSPDQMEGVGLKHTAREIAKKANVPMLPGTGLVQNSGEAITDAILIGYPVILKSTAGGGGIGMRVCHNAQELLGAYDAVSHLAETNFQNGGLFLEKYITRARHVEVQMFGNRHGEVVILGERDCSIQRRNQKVVEESPAPHLPDFVRADMFAAVKRLASVVGYRSAGTVEFLYDPASEQFYFLEVNTRLQVEHGVSEEVLGIDLVEWMIREAADELDLGERVPLPSGHSIQARIYAEDCLADFRPSAGRLDQAVFPEEARVETWVRDGMTISTLYDPMLAKIIVHGVDRADALHKLEEALGRTRLFGVTTNLQYLQALLTEIEFQEGKVHTRLLEQFVASECAVEVLDGGVQSTIQDWPGRIGYWSVGVPPSGPMDSLSFRIGNELLGNDASACGIELTLRGGRYLFRDDMWFCVTGADMEATLDGGEIPLYQPLLAKQGQVLHFGEARVGMRAYLLIAGGFDMPKTLGSAATFSMGGFGGHGGRALRTGDVLRVRGNDKPISISELKTDCRPTMMHSWTIGVTVGPHCTEEYLQPEYLSQLTANEWEVHFNSSRTGVRLMGPIPCWAREDGGDAGLHPSNIHDNAYAIGALDLTGDVPIFLGPDGPSLGGFVCPVTAAKAELWKIGQLRPSDRVRFQLLTLEDADDLRRSQEAVIEAIGRSSWAPGLPSLPPMSCVVAQDGVLVRGDNTSGVPMTIRCSGDENLLVEYGAAELDLTLRFQVHNLMQALERDDELPIVDLTPGTRSLQIHIDPSRMTVREASVRVMEASGRLPDLSSIRVPSRIVRLPLSWDDPTIRLAIERYQQSVRQDAPWCPSNLEFIRRINGLDSIEDVKRIVFEASYLVLGLGDVYLGAPVATPVDPRHRLVTTKYNPARIWTPENAVGIGGAYMCVYGMEGPGGYQLVGRTLPMWNRLRSTPSFEREKPWLLRFFDQIQFYPVTTDELVQLRQDFLRGRFNIEIQETSFDLGQYLQFLDSIRVGTQVFRGRQQAAFQAERERWQALGLNEYVPDHGTGELERTDLLDDDVDLVRCAMSGGVWKVLVSAGEEIAVGEPLIIVESMKMEFVISAPLDGVVSHVFVKPGDEVHSGKAIIGLLRTMREEDTA